MTARLSARLALGAAVLATGVTALPAPALAGPDTATLAAVTEQDPATGRNVKYPVKPGEVVPASLGVTNLGDAPVNGVVVQVRAFDDLDLLTKYDNCWYVVDSNLDIAWCEFDDVLAAQATLAPAEDLIVTRTNARADKVTTVVFRWVSKAWADELGGVQKLAENENGTDPVRGGGPTLTLAPRDLPLPSKPIPINFVYASLVTPPTASPTATASPTTSASPTASATPTAGVTPTGTAPSASPAAPGAGGGDGGGLPVTGSDNVAVAGAGVALLLLGGVGYLAARRRRTRFVA
ncbi:LPXTG cell wall anchor domain-containing protein [Micromonospora sp. 4G57]|uniref:LPXTG cell wall anchor domain-containing protein n=1 Tax=Micromonospora sicca TaxID=2202420 RepID=A0ABU5JH57_9ACTN|nr:MULTISPECIES: LPXTG cell wall anchor domain-containing protein [unclassified Micromonospora]MDZ5442388.1 LPXTG cell wall anchor domain-containing protein [Micromonospora sp. 4G57]MDZ5491822.1 LPXTG cell wall anchor domain-containing protein [Micromonospora sp. 4G53]